MSEHFKSTLEYTIDGKKYVGVEREAEVGEKVIIVAAERTYDMYENGDIIDAEEVGSFGICNCSVRTEGNEDGFISHREYHVLEPVNDEAESTAPSLVDLIANLSAEVTQLKRNHAEQIDTLFRNVQQLVEELAALQTAEPVDNTPVTLPKWIVDRLMGGYRG